MSYILDALKRAESERDRGAVPTLNTLLPTRTPVSGNGRPLLYIVIAGAVLLILLGALASRWLTPTPAPQTEAAVIAAPVAAPLAPPVAQQQPRPLPPPPQAQAELQRQPLVPAAHSLPEPSPVAKPAVAPAAPPIVALNELPDSLRRELPQLKAGGAMVSDIPANRMLIINGQLLHEGEAVVPGLVLENIGLRTAILSYKNQRFTINY